MALINRTKREINAKIVIYGPGRSGKSTNLNYIFRKLKPERRGKLKMMNLQKDRMLFFDFLPGEKGDMEGYTLRLHVYTVAGENVAPSSWKMVLKGADGVVFVADSDADKMSSNISYMEQLEDIFNSCGASMKDASLVIQFNKSDLQNALPMDEMKRVLVTNDAPVVTAVANRGDGVLESLFSVIRGVQARVRKEALEPDGPQKGLPSGSPETGYSPAPTLPAFSEDAGNVAQEEQETDLLLQDEGSRARPEVELAGEPVPCPGGLKVPLIIRCGECRKSTTVTVTVSVSVDNARGKGCAGVGFDS